MTNKQTTVRRPSPPCPTHHHSAYKATVAVVWASACVSLTKDQSEEARVSESPVMRCLGVGAALWHWCEWSCGSVSARHLHKLGVIVALHKGGDAAFSIESPHAGVEEARHQTGNGQYQ